MHEMVFHDSLKGQSALRPGHRPGYAVVGVFALKGQKPSSMARVLLPLQGVSLLHTRPRTMPWAKSSLPSSGRMAKNLRNLNDVNESKAEGRRNSNDNISTITITITLTYHQVDG